MSKDFIKKKIMLFIVTGILIILCAFLISLYNNYQDKKFRKEITKIQDKNVYKKDRIKLTDITYDNNQIYIRLENIANILDSKYKEKDNKCYLISDNIKLELKVNSKKAKLNNKNYSLKHKIISVRNVKFISKEDMESIYDVIYDKDSRTIFNKFSSKILIIKTDNDGFIYKTNPIKTINRNGLYINKYKTIKETKKAYNYFKKQKNTIVNIESVIKVSEESKKSKNNTKIDANQMINTKLSDYIKNNSSKKEVVIAVIDSGIDYNLDIFKNRLINTKYNYSSTGKDAKDDFGHGTKVASTIIDCSNNNIKLLPIKVINKEGEGSILSLYVAIKEAIDNKVDIINISLNMRYSSDTDIIENLIKEATDNGIQVVISAGNNSGDVAKFAPANFKSAIVVAASNEWRMATDYTNIGKTVDYCTIGNATKNTVTINGEDASDSYGTSISAAYISSIIASLKHSKKSIDDFVTDAFSDNIGKFVALEYYNTTKKAVKETTNNDIIHTLTYYIDDWQNLNTDDLEKSYNATPFIERAYFYQNLSKKEKELLRKKIDDLNLITTTYSYKMNKENEYIIVGTQINEFGDYTERIALKKQKTDITYKLLEKYDIKDYDPFKVNTSTDEIDVNRDGNQTSSTWLKNGYFYFIIYDETNNKTTKLKIETVTPNGTNYATEEYNKKPIEFTITPLSGSANYQNFNLIGVMCNSEANSPDHGIMDIKYSYTKPAHSTVTINTTNYDNTYHKPSQNLITFNKNDYFCKNNCRWIDTETKQLTNACRTKLNKHVYTLGEPAVDHQGDLNGHYNINRTNYAYIDVNFHNTGNRYHKTGGHVVQYTSYNNYKTDTGSDWIYHDAFSIIIEPEGSSLTIDLNDDNVTPAKYYKSENLVGKGEDYMTEDADGKSISRACNSTTNWLSEEPNRPGYEFKGWNTTQLGLETTIDSYNLGCHIKNIAKAQWEITPYKVEYDFNGATKDGSPKKNNVYYKKMMPDVNYLPEKVANITLDYNGSGQSNEYINYKYNFITYTYTNAAGKSINCYDNTGKAIVIWNILGNGKVVAQWDGKITLPNAERTGYNFKGWDIDPNVTSGKYPPGDYQLSGNTTLYAIWEPITYTVNLYRNTPPRANGGHHDGYVNHEEYDHESNPIYANQSGWTYVGDHWTKEFVFDKTRLTELPSEMFYLKGWTTNNPTWYAKDSFTMNKIGLSINASYYAINLTETEGDIINLIPSYTEHSYIIDFIRSEDPDILEVTSGDIPDMHLKYEDCVLAPEGSELYKVDKNSDQVFRFFLCKENNVRYYQLDSDPPICQLTDVDGAVYHLVAQWLPFRIRIDYFSITDRERGMDIIFSEGVFGQLEIQVEEEVEKIRVDFPQPDEDYTLSNYMEYVIKYDDRNLDYALDPDLNFKKTYEYNPIGMTNTTPSYPLYPKKSETKQKFFVKYSYKPLVTKKIWIHSYRDRRWINSTATYINFENRDRVPMSGKIRTRIRYDSWLED